jgi:stage V sporulation protein R
MTDYLYTGAEWTWDLLQRAHDACAEVAVGEMGLSVYPNQLEIVTSEQMLDAYSSVGMPLFYKHWSFGKQFAHQEALYRKGYMGLAYELVINSSPCISYLMEENTATMQTLVIAHAAFGHNHFFKNNSTFTQWTDAESIADYLHFAKDYIQKCEEKYGRKEVETLLDAAHALRPQSVNRSKKLKRFSFKEEEKRQLERAKEAERTYNDLWAHTVPKRATTTEAERNPLKQYLPEENLLYFLEKYAPRLKPWEREILRIVRKIEQYFLPQRQTQVMNEGCATFVHYEILHRLHQKGQLPDAAMLEFFHSHSNVIFQPGFDDKRYSGFNPYALGFAMMQDIKRIAISPTAEDREWFRHYAGCGDYLNVLKEGWENFRDESFILQYLSPKVIRDFKLFTILDDEENEEHVEVSAIHNEQGYRNIQKLLARQYEPDYRTPSIEVVDVDLSGDRNLGLRYTAHGGILLDEEGIEKMLEQIASIWRYDVSLDMVDEEGETIQYYSHEYVASE